MALTFELLRHSIYYETGIGWGLRGGIYSSTSRAAQSVTIPTLIHSAMSGNETQQLWLFVPDAATNRERPAGGIAVDTGVVVNAGQAWSVVGTAEQVEIIKYLSPTELFAVINATFQRLSQLTQTPLGTFPDSDNEYATTANWTALNGATLAKDSSAGNVITGRRSLKITATAGGGGAGRSGLIPVNPGKEIYISAVFRVQTGSGKLVVWDATNGVELGSATAYSGSRFVHVSRSITIPTNCKHIEVRPTAVANGDIVYFDHFSGPFHPGGDLNLLAPTWLDEEWRLRKVRARRYSFDVGSSFLDAATRGFEDYALKEDVIFHVLPSDVNPFTLQLRGAAPDHDLWVEGLRRSSELLSGTLTNSSSDETIETDLPQEQIILEASLAVVDYILGRDPTNLEMQVAGGRIAQKLRAWSRTQSVESALQRQERFAGGLGRRV